MLHNILNFFTPKSVSTSPDPYPYMYRKEDDGTMTPLSKAEWKIISDELWKQGYWDDCKDLIQH